MNWRTLEQDFREIAKANHNFSLAAQYYQRFPTKQEQEPEPWGRWSLCGNILDHERARFEALATMAGNALLNYPEWITAANLQVSDPVQRWLCAMMHFTNAYSGRDPFLELDENGDRISTIMAGIMGNVIEWSAVLCLKLAAHNQDIQQQPATVPTPAESDQKQYKTSLGRNIYRLMRDCGWSLNDLEAATGIAKKNIIGHIRHGKGVRAFTLKVYADAFSKQLDRKINATDLEL